MSNFRGGRSARCRSSLVMVALVWGVAESAACPLMTGRVLRAGGSCRAAGRGFGAVNVVQRFGLVAFLCGVISRGGRGQEQPALPRSAGHRRCPGDKMIDWVSPPAGMRPLSLIRPSAWPCQARAAAADSGSAGAGRGGPHRVNAAAYVVRPGPARSPAGHRVMEREASGGGQRVVAELGQDVAGLPEDLAGSSSAARLPLHRSLTWA